MQCVFGCAQGTRNPCSSISAGANLAHAPFQQTASSRKDLFPYQNSMKGITIDCHVRMGMLTFVFSTCKCIQNLIQVFADFDDTSSACWKEKKFLH